MAVRPFNDAVSVALTRVVVGAAEAVKLALVWPAATVALVGTVTIALLLDSATAVPPLGAVPLMVTVQLAVPGAVTVPGVQLNEVTVIGDEVGSVIVPAEVVVEIECPPASEVDAPESESGMEPVAVDAICMLTSARSPLETMVVFRPNTIQVSDADVLEHETDLPAAEAAAPADAFTDVTLAAGKPRVHSKLAGCAPLLDVNETGTETVVPGVPEVVPTVSPML